MLYNARLQEILIELMHKVKNDYQLNVYKKKKIMIG